MSVMAISLPRSARNLATAPEPVHAGRAYGRRKRFLRRARWTDRDAEDYAGGAVEAGGIGMSDSRKALVVGINDYEHFSSLRHAESDATAIAERLAFHGDADRTRNFEIETMLHSAVPVRRATLRPAIHKLFADAKGLDLVFYFAGHGFVSETGGNLVTADGIMNDPGIAMDELYLAAQRSSANSVLLMLDCCHAGALGNVPAAGGEGPRAVLRENTTIIAASLPMQAAVESPEGGLFSAALKDALDGAAADILGNISIAALHAVIERRFSLWHQRPVAKSYVSRPIVLRKVPARLSQQELRRLISLFPSAEYRYPLTPDHDPERDVNEKARIPEVPEKVEIGRIFKRYRDAGLVHATVRGEDFYYVAQRSHTVELTLFGREYWRLVTRGGV
jgi:hypothetical protein